MKRQLFIVDGEFRSLDGTLVSMPNGFLGLRPDRQVTDAEQAAYEFGRQEKAEEILEALAREFFGEKT